MRTTKTREIEGFDDSDTVLAQNPAEICEEEMTKWPHKVRFRNKVRVNSIHLLYFSVAHP
jgi:hypothetical protein